MSGLTYRRASEDGYRVSFDGVEIGSISKRTSHTFPQRTYWHWGIGIMPLMDHGGRPPSGDDDTFEAALADFKQAFADWHAQIAPELWQKNIDYMRAGAERWKRK